MMPRALVSLLLLASLSFGSEALAASSQCPEHFFLGEAPNTVVAQGDHAQAICYQEYGLLHSADKKTAYWSAEHLTTERVDAAEQLPRRNSFHPDPNLPPDDRAELVDYRGSGMDRGHLSPNGDFDNPEAQRESFSLANIMPQDPTNNRGLWARIEAAVRDLARKDGELFVVTGPIFDAHAARINGRVAIPSRIFKAVYDPARKEAGVYIVDNAADTEWQEISLAELSDISGIEVFPRLSNRIREQVMDLPGPQYHPHHRPERDDEK